MTTLYGIKNCDTVKKAMKWLDSNKIDYAFHDFRVDGINENMVNTWLQTIPLDKLVNKRSTTWKNLSESEKNSLNEDNAASYCVKYETLIKRPVLEYQGQVYIGFSDKAWSEIF